MTATRRTKYDRGNRKAVGARNYSRILSAIGRMRTPTTYEIWQYLGGGQLRNNGLSFATIQRHIATMLKRREVRYARKRFGDAHYTNRYERVRND